MPHHTSAADFTAGILTALAHPNRVRILQLLRGGPHCNCELAPALRLEQSNLSRHLRILVDAGVLVSWKDGLRVNFKVADDRIFRILDTAASLARRNIHAAAALLNEP